MPQTSPSGSTKLALLLSTGLTLAASHAGAQHTSPEPAPVTAVPGSQSTVTAHATQPTKPEQQKHTISGVVWFEDRDTVPAPGVSVLLKGTANGAVTDAQGNFTLTLSNKPQHPVTIQFSFIGYNTIEKEVKLSDVDHTATGKTVIKESDVALMGEVVVVHTNPVSRLWWRIKGLFY